MVFLGVLFWTFTFFSLLSAAQFFKFTIWTTTHTQIYISLATPDINCIHDIFHRMTDNKLKLYANKTEFLIIDTQKQRNKRDCYHIRDLRRIRRYITSTCATLFGKGSYPVSSLLSFSRAYHFLNHCIGSLSDIALLLRSVQLPIKHFHQSYQRINFHCSHLQDSPYSFDHLIVIYLVFAVLRQMSELELFQLLHRLCGTHFLLVLSL